MSEFTKWASGFIFNNTKAPTNEEAFNAGRREGDKYKSLLFRIGADIAKAECNCDTKSMYPCERCKLVEKFRAIRKEINNA